ncbi:glycosyl hydrolase family 18 protein [Paenibacillus lentus]|uniref:Glycosyl hydrolase n=1 Tax=Paenibacillus lentus TaxID=1338368 RepID=A0A3S8RTY5_9BACL|nr:glycosyl hydrolase family 18 protein [Paenibacillus lentus]AZK46436.1 glycosyl hydrolase [Paenibacillus lentus]
MTSKWLYAAGAVILVVIIGVLWLGRHEKGQQPIQAVTVEPDLELAAWVVDWKWESGVDDLELIGKQLDRLQVFAAYFDSENRLYFTEDMHEALPHIFETARKGGVKYVDLTIVNDRWNSDGTAVQKDPGIVSRMLVSRESQEEHIAEIIDVVERYGFDGVEMDYEKIGEADWEKLCIFYKELHERLQAKGKALRIILEPRTPIERLPLPEGPVYVMMAYNLFGSHSGPGPKADHAFIKKLASRMKVLPGEAGIALSVGGFDWAAKGKVTSLTEKQAVKLLRRSNVAVPMRDKASGSVYFTYKDEGGQKHTVWYADGETISQWIDTVKQAGYTNIALWRLGEFERSTVDRLKDL